MTRENKASRYADGFNPIKTATQLYDTYDFVSQFTLADATTNYNLKTQQATSFYNVPVAWLCIIWTTEDITIRFNSTSYPAINIPASESPFEFRDILKITNIYLTNQSGANSSVKIMMV